MSNTGIQNEVNIENLIGFRAPSDQEQQKIGCYLLQKYKQDIKSYQKQEIILVVFASLLTLSLMSTVSELVFLPFAFMEGVMVLGAFSYLEKIRKNLRVELSLWSTGNYKVLDGTVLEIEANSNELGMINVRFQSTAGEILEGVYTIPMQNVHIGSPLLLAYMQTEDLSSTHIFTIYMMTERN